MCFLFLTARDVYWFCSFHVENAVFFAARISLGAMRKSMSSAQILGIVPVVFVMFVLFVPLCACAHVSWAFCFGNSWLVCMSG